jgi:hypothetical protein
MPCPYAGSGLVIYRKLYRTSSSLISVYYVDTINDNTTTTYTDNFTDASLELNPVISTSTYNTIPANVNDVCSYIQRVFAISGNTLYISEPYLPFNFDLANAIAISPDGINLTSVVPWGDQLYISAPDTWYRLQGTKSSSWQVRPTFSEEGMIDRCTAIPTRYGVLGRWYDGIYAFDGMLSRNITLNKVAQSFFLNIPSTTACAASWDGIHYRFFDPSVSGKCLVLDFTYHPTIRVYYEDIVNAHKYHRDTGIHYYGKTDGYQYADGTTEAVIASFQTGDRLTKEARYKQKQATYLYYDINTNGQDVTVTFYADGVASANTITLNNSSRTKARVSIPGNVQGYRISIAVSCANSYGVEIYDPWAIDVNPFGD